MHKTLRFRPDREKSVSASRKRLPKVRLVHELQDFLSYSGLHHLLPTQNAQTNSQTASVRQLSQQHWHFTLDAQAQIAQLYSVPGHRRVLQKAAPVAASVSLIALTLQPTLLNAATVNTAPATPSALPANENCEQWIQTQNGTVDACGDAPMVIRKSKNETAISTPPEQTAVSQPSPAATTRTPSPLVTDEIGSYANHVPTTATHVTAPSVPPAENIAAPPATTTESAANPVENIALREPKPSEPAAPAPTPPQNTPVEESIAASQADNTPDVIELKMPQPQYNLTHDETVAITPKSVKETEASQTQTATNASQPSPPTPVAEKKPLQVPLVESTAAQPTPPTTAEPAPPEAPVATIPTPQPEPISAPEATTTSPEPAASTEPVVTLPTPQAEPTPPASDLVLKTNETQTQTIQPVSHQPAATVSEAPVIVIQATTLKQQAQADTPVTSIAMASPTEKPKLQSQVRRSDRYHVNMDRWSRNPVSQVTKQVVRFLRWLFT